MALARGVLSQRVVTAAVDVTFGSVDYSDPRIVAALCDGGLKGRATVRRQIVTALKWLVMVLTWPVRMPAMAIVWCLTWVALMVTRTTRKICCVVSRLYSESSALVRAYWRVYNKRTRAVACTGLVGSLALYGPAAVLVWVCLLVVFVFCTLPADARYYIKLAKKIQDAWDAVEEDDSITPAADGGPLEVRSGRNRFACRLAARAISRVGLLKPTKANALVYQKVILDEMKVLNVRFGDRVRVLPLAVVACLERPDAVDRVEGVIDALTCLPGSL
ncbi:p30 [Maize white line mosaic virus]|nr:unnamed protein product [Maize white line mosaic virus]ABQ65749.1 p30 [Maize white line mosaic virus]